VTAQQPAVSRAIGEATTSRYPTLVPKEVKIERPGIFSGKHSELQNWLFVMKQYLDTVNIGSGPEACRLVVTYLRGDALTWWRSFANDDVKVFQNLTLDALFTELS
jgi:hypothetical protein